MPGSVGAREAGFIAEPAPVYFDRLAPSQALGLPPVVLLHGAFHTGSCWLRTPDGRPGWAQRFAARGHPVYVPDWPGHGCSGALRLDEVSGELICQAMAALVESIGEPVVFCGHSMGGALLWRIAELCGDRLETLVALAPGPPGNIQAWPEVVERDGSRLLVKSPYRTVWLDLDDVLVPDSSFSTTLLGESQRFPLAHFADYERSLTPIATRLLAERLNVEGSQVRVHDPSVLAGRRVFVVTGENDIDHRYEVDGAIVDWLALHGADAEFVWLADRGIHGNGHMLMLEENSDEIADLVIDLLAARS